jgi:hypothetical protein
VCGGLFPRKQDEASVGLAVRLRGCEASNVVVGAPIGQGQVCCHSAELLSLKESGDCRIMIQQEKIRAWLQWEKFFQDIDSCPNIVCIKQASLSGPRNLVRSTNHLAVCFQRLMPSSLRVSESTARVLHFVIAGLLMTCSHAHLTTLRKSGALPSSAFCLSSLLEYL